MDIFSLGCSLCNILFGISFYIDCRDIKWDNIYPKLILNYFITFNNPKIDTREAYWLYFGHNGYMHHLLSQLKERYLYGHDYIDLISNMIHLDHNDRISSDQLIKSIEYIQSY